MMLKNKINESSIMTFLTISFSIFLIYIIFDSIQDNYIVEVEETSEYDGAYRIYSIIIDKSYEVEIKLDTTNEYSLTINDGLKLLQNDNVVCTGRFYPLGHYQSMVTQIKRFEPQTIIDEKTLSDLEYVFYEDMYTYKYLTKINGLDYMFILDSNISEEQATECFYRTTFLVK